MDSKPTWDRAVLLHREQLRVRPCTVFAFGRSHYPGNSYARYRLTSVFSAQAPIRLEAGVMPAQSILQTERCQ